ncbi:MAG TPA: TIM-barrel domain-containing protein, partial [Feifaniaceae bacterium]|nr:TIM-barrel domain-containing protein [Feifaniaceae bacterium]
STECGGETLFEAVLSVGSPAHALESYAAETGAPALPPVWAFGPWISSNGWNTQAEALEQVAAMNEHKIPATVMVLEAWSDEETFYIWNDAEYTPRADGSAFRYEDFTFPADGKWPNPKAFCETLAQNNLNLVLWQIPAVKYTPHPETTQLPLDEAYAIEQKLCIENDDGTPYRITEMWFCNSLMPDFTNPDTCSWWLEKRCYLVEQLGVAGFKTDGGEFLFNTEARLFDGQIGSAAHNAYPNAYQGAYHAFLEETRGKGQGVLFSRAGFTGAQKNPIHWAGDQVSSFSELEAQLKAGLSLGLSGVPFWGFDIGGFAGELPSAELYLRSAAFGAFAPVMQFHSEPRNGQYYMTDRKAWNNDRSPWNLACVQGDERILTVYRLFANLRMNLLPYLWQEAKHCATTARPMMAHLVYDFYETDLESVRAIEDEYMLGRSLLVAPVIQEGAKGRSVYLPTGTWRDFYTGEHCSGGRTIELECGLDRIPVFVRDNTAIPVNANAALVLGSEGKDGAVSSRTDAYERLGFLLYGAPEEIRFADDLGNDLTLTRSASGYALSGRLNVSLSLIDMTRLSAVADAATVFGRSVPVTVIPQNTESNA